MPTVVVILTFIISINDWLFALSKKKKSFENGYFDIYDQFKYHAQLKNVL